MYEGDGMEGRLKLAQRARKKRRTKTETTKLEEELLTEQQRQDLRNRSFTPDQQREFEDARLILEKHEKARTTLGTARVQILLGEELYDPKDLSEEQKKQLHDLDRKLPKIMFRVASAAKNLNNRWFEPTNGVDTRDIHIPAAHKYCDKRCARSLIEEPYLVSMIAHRLLWNDYNRDPTMYWTTSLLFELVLGTTRMTRDEKFISIFTADTDQLEKGEATSRNGDLDYSITEDRRINYKQDAIRRVGPAEFFDAEDLLRILRIPECSSFAPHERGELRSNWFTHEHLCHGLTLCMGGNYEAKLLQLLKLGLFKFLPDFKTVEDEDMRALYSRCVRFRSISFVPSGAPKPFTQEDLALADKLANCSKSSDEANRRAYHLHFFLGFLGLNRRAKQDPLFVGWIKKHYRAQDLAFLEYDRSIRVANNIPEVMQMLELARDACDVFNLPRIPPTQVWLEDPNFEIDGNWPRDLPQEVQLRLSRTQLRKRKYKKKQAELENADLGEAEYDPDTGKLILKWEPVEVWEISAEVTAAIEQADVQGWVQHSHRGNAKPYTKRKVSGKKTKQAKKSKKQVNGPWAKVVASQGAEKEEDESGFVDEDIRGPSPDLEEDGESMERHSEASQQDDEREERDTVSFNEQADIISSDLEEIAESAEPNVGASPDPT